MTELSIIIPSFNTKELLYNCLKSIFNQTKEINFEVIVVDNASTDGSTDMVKKQFSQVKVIINNKNEGYAKANNIGIKAARGDNILFLNSDTVILDKAIEKSLCYLINNPKIDILGCKLLNSDKTIQPSGGYFPKLRQIFYMMFFIDDLPIFNKIIKPYQQSNLGFYKNFQMLDWVTGAFMMIKKKVIDKIRGFDENFFMYSEEVDLCFRAKKAGFKVAFFPDAKVIHIKGSGLEAGFEKAVLGEFLGLIKFFNKHKPTWEIPILKTLLKIGAILRMVFFGILKGDKIKQKIYEKAFKLV